jgi:WD40 repeat protein
MGGADRLALAYDSRTIRVYDCASGEMVASLEGHTDQVRPTDIGPSGGESVGRPFCPRIPRPSDLTDVCCLCQPPLTPRQVNCLGTYVTAEGDVRLLSGSADRTVR